MSKVFKTSMQFCSKSGVLQQHEIFPEMKNNICCIQSMVEALFVCFQLLLF